MRKEKRTYAKPSMKVYEMKEMPQLLSSSIEGQVEMNVIYEEEDL